LNVIVLIIFGAACQLKAVNPQARHGAKMIYDPVGKQVILFGGRGNGGVQGDLYNDLWILDLAEQRWKELEVSSGPTPRLSPGLVYDPSHHQMILFGGYSNQGRVNDTWLLDLDSYEWEEVSPAQSPPARSDMGLAYDDLNHIVVLFGGYCLENQRDYCGDTWVFDPAIQNWIEMEPEISPPVMYGHTLEYDPLSEKFLVWGGHMSDFADGRGSSAGYNDSIWSYSYMENQWLEIPPGVQSHPIARYWHQASYVSGHPGLLVFGGDSGYGYKNDSWFYDPSSQGWDRLTTTQAPPARIVGTMVYCPDDEQVVLFGGLDNDFSNLNDTWIYSDISGEWEEISR
jgi:N-acetylneuraminic acid mutarotase